MDSSDEEMLWFQILLEEEQKNKKRRRVHKVWVHDICQKRNVFGEYHHLFNDLKKDPVKFFEYFRMCFGKFETLLNILREDLQKQTTKFRRPIEPEERLAICLR
ncbi:unnamed protein product [Arctia plantaginis]|uniref:Protein ALP1-like n=1 Tax=Arctia plantaginis TaxID=874455 RepID=A0A8S1B1J3_ARCPL|nr:unnamed protein product [Arctia plantaginis]